MPRHLPPTPSPSPSPPSSPITLPTTQPPAHYLKPDMLSYDVIDVADKQPTSAVTISRSSKPSTQTKNANNLPKPQHHGQARSRCQAPQLYTHHIWLVTGPAGCGKTTVATQLASILGMPYVEGDVFHPQSNVEKMSNGIPLTDADRWDWLTALREEALRQLEAGHNGVIVTCSALKRKYRDVIRVAPYFTSNLCLHFIYLQAPKEVLMQRVMARKGHYMGASMLHSQFDILEPPAPDERDVVSVDVSRAAHEVLDDVLTLVLHNMSSSP